MAMKLGCGPTLAEMVRTIDRQHSWLSQQFPDRRASGVRDGSMGVAA